MIAYGFIDLLGSVVETFLEWNVLMSWAKPLCWPVWRIPISPMILHAYHLCRWNDQSFHIRLYRSGGKYSVANFRSDTFSSVEVRSDITLQGHIQVLGLIVCQPAGTQPCTELSIHLIHISHSVFCVLMSIDPENHVFWLQELVAHFQDHSLSESFPNIKTALEYPYGEVNRYEGTCYP